MPRALEQWFRHTRGPLDARERRDVGKPARHPEVRAALGELRRLGVTAKLTVLWSDDGSGVEEDRPDVVYLVRSLPRADRAPAALRDPTGRVMSLGVAGVIRHELGHALLFMRPRDARGAEFVRLFGDVRIAYPPTGSATRSTRCCAACTATAVWPTRVTAVRSRCTPPPTRTSGSPRRSASPWRSAATTPPWPPGRPATAPPRSCWPSCATLPHGCAPTARIGP
jgi:hypothetical protein